MKKKKRLKSVKIPHLRKLRRGKLPQSTMEQSRSGGTNSVIMVDLLEAQQVSMLIYSKMEQSRSGGTNLVIMVNLLELLDR